MRCGARYRMIFEALHDLVESSNYGKAIPVTLDRAHGPVLGTREFVLTLGIADQTNVADRRDTVEEELPRSMR